MFTQTVQLPRISIVMPSYNQGQFLSEALNSIFRQDYPNVEVVVMDGGSSDDSVPIIRSFAPRLKYWQSQKDGGQSAAINAGMKHCTGELVTWLNSDDFYWGQALWSVGRAYVQHPGRGLYVGNGLRFYQQTGAFTPFCSRHIAFDRAALLHGPDYLLQPAVFLLREAWNQVGGLNSHLNFCMDWDIFLRIAKGYSAVVLQEFLAVSLEYAETKTRSGKMKRATEIVHMVRSHTGTEVTPGSLLFLLDTLLDTTGAGMPKEVHDHLHGALAVLARHISDQYGGGHGFPEWSDPDTKCYLPFATPASCRATPSTDLALQPTISIIVPARNQRDDLCSTLESIQHQNYGSVQPFVVDRDSCDGTDDLLHQLGLPWAAANFQQGPAYAIDQGFKLTDGEIVSWINPGDLLATDALQSVSQAFAADPDLDLVYGNAVSIDYEGNLHLANHGTHTSGLWISTLPKEAKGVDVLAVPQPTVFFRRRLLERHGRLNESLQYIFDYELFTRFAQHAKIAKIEQILALSRLRVNFGPRWNDILVEAYRLYRPRWPSIFSRRFPAILREFVMAYVRRKFAGRPRTFVLLAAAALIAVSAVTRLGNPERWWKNRLPVKDLARRPPLFVSGRKKMYHSLVMAPARLDKLRNGDGIMRTLHFLRTISTVECFHRDNDVTADLKNLVDVIHTPASIAALRPDLICEPAQRQSWRTRLAGWLRRCRLPMPGPQYPLHITEQFPHLFAFLKLAIQEALERHEPDFLLVSSPCNPLALSLNLDQTDARLILMVHELEAERIKTMAASQRGLQRVFWHGEARRTCRYEQENLARYDGIITSTERVRRHLADHYGYPTQRVCVREGDGLGEWLGWLKSQARYAGACILPLAA